MKRGLAYVHAERGAPKGGFGGEGRTRWRVRCALRGVEAPPPCGVCSTCPTGAGRGRGVGGLGSRLPRGGGSVASVALRIASTRTATVAPSATRVSSSFAEEALSSRSCHEVTK